MATGYTAASGAAASIILSKVGLKRGMKYRWSAVWIARYRQQSVPGWWLVVGVTKVNIRPKVHSCHHSHSWQLAVMLGWTRHLVVCSCRAIADRRITGHYETRERSTKIAQESYPVYKQKMPQGSHGPQNAHARRKKESSICDAGRRRHGSEAN